MLAMLRRIDRQERNDDVVVVSTITLDERAQMIEAARAHVARCEQELDRAKLQLEEQRARFRDEIAARGLLD